MTRAVTYGPRERFFLWSLAVVGFVVLNSVFVYGLLFRPDWIREAQTNPVAAVFIAEAIILMGTFAYLLAKWKVSRLHWGWFIALSLLGSMAFALPIVLLWPGRSRGEGEAGVRRGAPTPGRRRRSSRSRTPGSRTRPVPFRSPIP